MHTALHDYLSITKTPPYRNNSERRCSCYPILPSPDISGIGIKIFDLLFQESVLCNLSAILRMALQNLNSCVNDICKGSPSRIRIVRLISFGITTLPRSSIRLTIPVAFIINLRKKYLFAVLLFDSLADLYQKRISKFFCN